MHSQLLSTYYITKMVFFVDIQGYQYKNKKFECKELAMKEEDSFGEYHRIIKFSNELSNYNGQIIKQYIFNERMHGIPYDYEDPAVLLKEEDLKSFLMNTIGAEKIIMVKGLQKKKWLEDLLPERNRIINAEDLNCPRLDTFDDFIRTTRCNYHQKFNFRSGFNCAQQNVEFLDHWFRVINSYHRVNMCEQLLSKLNVTN